MARVGNEARQGSVLPSGHEKTPAQAGAFFVSPQTAARIAMPYQVMGSKRFAETFLRTLAGSQMRPFMAM
jgi:hypothetical protein